jgi:predicted RNA-binding protein associated with RNAse of E/G family
MDTLVLRFFNGSKIAEAAPHLLVEETDERLVHAIWPGVMVQTANIPKEQMMDAWVAGAWELYERPWLRNRAVIVSPREAHYSVGAFWDGDSCVFKGWYLNLQTPFQRTPLGYDTRDQILDIWVNPDRSWRWKDEDQLADAVRHGIFTSDQAASVRAEGERLIANLDQIVPTGWEHWEIPPNTPNPVLPPGWATLPGG